VRLERRIAILPLHRSVGPRLRKIQVHLLPEQVEALQVVDGVLRAVDIVVDDEGLALALQALFGDDVDDGAELVEETVQGFDQGWDLDALVEVADVYPVLSGLWLAVLVVPERWFVRCAMYERCVGCGLFGVCHCCELALPAC